MGQPNRRRTKTTTAEVFPTVQGFRGLCPCKKTTLTLIQIQIDRKSTTQIYVKQFHSFST